MLYLKLINAEKLIIYRKFLNTVTSLCCLGRIEFLLKTTKGEKFATQMKLEKKIESTVPKGKRKSMKTFYR